MRGRLNFIALALAALVIAAGFVSWRLPRAMVARAFAEQVGAPLRLNGAAQGRASFRLLPRPTLEIAGAHLSDSDGALSIEAATIAFTPSLGVLLAGRLEFTAVELRSAKLRLDLDRMRPPRLFDRPATRIARLAILDGELALTSQRRGLATHIGDINIALDWPSATGAVLVGSSIWHGETLRIAAWLAAPEAWLRGAASPATLQVSSPILALELDGILPAESGPAFRGQARLRSTDAAQLARWCGDVCGLPQIAIRRLETSANIDASPKGLAMEALSLRLDDNSLEGAAAWRFDRPIASFAGTLAADHLSLPPDLSPWFEAMAPMRGASSLDLDLRLSAGAVEVGSFSLSEAAFSLQRRGEALRFDLAQARAYRGDWKANTMIEAVGPMLRVAAEASARGVDPAPLCRLAACPFEISGRAELDIRVAGAGASLAAALRSTRGEARLSLANGALTSLDLEQALRRMEKRPLNPPPELRPGRLAFDQTFATARINDGVAEIDDGEMQGAATSLSFAGDIDLPAGTLNLRGRARQSGPGGQVRPDSPQLRFTLAGPWRAAEFRLGSDAAP